MDSHEPSLERSAERAVANPNRPADLGFSALGLCMQFFGGFFICLLAYLVFMTLIAGLRGGAVWILAIVVLAIIRSGLHFAAGMRLSQGDWDGRRAVMRYVYFALAQTIASITLLHISPLGGGIDFASDMSMVVLLMGWPTALAVVMSLEQSKKIYAHAKEEFESVRARDYGVEGAGALMTALGAVGVIVALLMLYTLVSTGAYSDGLGGILLTTLAVVLVARSAAHGAAGVGAMRGVTADRFTQSVKRYGMLAAASVVVFFASTFTFGGFNIMLLATLLLVGGVLALWPVILNSYASSVALAAIVASEADIDDEPQILPRARDAGLTAIGFWLLSDAVWRLTGWIAGLISSTGNMGAGGLSLLQGSDSLGLPAWTTPIMAALALWTACELIFMTSRYKIAGLVFGVVWGCLGAWAVVKMLPDATSALAPRGSDLGFANLQAVLPFAMVAMVLVFPVLIIVLSLKELPGDKQ